MSKFDINDLIETGLVRKKSYNEGKYKGLSVLKYNNKVFYNNLWNTDERLLDCRGTVIDEDNNIIVYPFTKAFNYNENGTTVYQDTEVVCVDKINGFMCAVSYRKEYALLVSTTGTLCSSYAELARRYVESLDTQIFEQFEGFTFMFEVCDISDPHIVKENYGIYLIGMRTNTIGSDLFSEEQLDTVAEMLECFRPSWSVRKFSNVVKDARRTTKEGFMVRSLEGEMILKIKGTHYLTKKFLMRMSKQKINLMFQDVNKFKKSVDEEFYELCDSIVNNNTEEQWTLLTEQEKRYKIEEYLKGGYYGI